MADHISLQDKLKLVDEFKKLVESTTGSRTPLVAQFEAPVVEDLSLFGYWCLLIGFFCMALSTLYFYGAAVNARGNKFFEVLTMSITGLSALAYLTMFSGSGKNWVEEVPGTITPVYWARYVDWLLTTPLMIWDILSLAGARKDDIMLCCVLDFFMIAFGLIGAQTPDQSKWLFFIIGSGCYIHIALMVSKYANVKKFGTEAQELYKRVAWMTLSLWSFYPLMWIMCEGVRVISVSLEASLYMVLDVTAKCLFGFFIVHARGALESIQNVEMGYTLYSA